MLFGQYPKVNVFTGTANLVEKLTTPTRRKRQFYCQIRVLQEFVPVYATRPNSCILSISADRDAGQVEKGVNDY